MAKRSPVDEKPFRPLDVSVLNAVVKHVPTANGGTQPVPPALEARPPVNPPNPSARSPREPESPPPRAPVTIPALPRLDQEKRILFTREETQAMDRLINNLAVRLKAQVKLSHVVRALTALLLHAEGRIDQRAGERGPLIRPPNGDFGALQLFERDIAEILASAMRDAGVPRTTT